MELEAQEIDTSSGFQPKSFVSSASQKRLLKEASKAKNGGGDDYDDRDDDFQVSVLNLIFSLSPTLRKNRLEWLFLSGFFRPSLIFTPGNTIGGSFTVPLTSCLTGLDKSVLQIKTKIISCHTADSKPVEQEVNGTVILPPWYSLFTL